MGNFIENRSVANGYFPGSVLAQAKSKVGGFRQVFVSLTGPKPAPMYPPFGGIVKNPFKAPAKMFAGDLVQYKVDGSCYLLKTYEVDKEAAESPLKLHIASGLCKNGEIFRHIPCVGDILMVAPASADGKGTAAKVTEVTVTRDTAGNINGWDVTFSAALAATVNKGTVLVEAVAEGSNKTPLVTAPNCYLDSDFDFIYNPSVDDEDFDNARYLFAPVLMMGAEFAWMDRMSPLPEYVKKQNKSLVPEWFKL